MSKFDKVMIESAKLWAEQSYCVKKKVGVVLAIDDRIIATGYNGTVSGQPNVCEIETKCEHCNEDGKIWITDQKYIDCGICHGTNIKLKTSNFTVHAEQNVIAYCAKEGIATKDTTMYVTLSPCSLCAKLIVQAGIKRVVFIERYKDTNGLKFLKDCGVKVKQHG